MKKNRDWPAEENEMLEGVGQAVVVEGLRREAEVPVDNRRFSLLLSKHIL